MLCLQIFISMNSVFKPFVPLGDMASSRYSFGHHSTSEHQTSIVDDLLFEIYDRWYDNRHDSFESDTFTECSSTSEVGHWRRNSVFREIDNKHSQWLHQGILETQSIQQLRKMIPELQHRVNYTSSRLVRQLKRRDRRWAKLQHNCDLVTAILQASSQKRRVDTRIRFSLEPPPGDSAFEQWKDAMKAVSRLPLGIPDSFRRKVWLSLADNHIKELRIDWNKTIRFAFNERSNPDDNTLGMQIVKDLHRTGCSGFSGHDNDEDRAILKRVLLGYARWNKTVGYCQGFNVIAALLLEVMDRKEDDALKVMIYLIDHVLPESYYANNLRSLSVDMAVFRDLLGLMFPKLSKHLDYLQHAAQDKTTGASYEPPLTNVFTMQWFLTMFATCLPKDLVLRVWDSILLEGSEILLRTALAIWGKLAKRIMSVSSADEFYSLMGTLTQEMMDGKIFHADSLVKFIYACAPFPMPQLPELREKYTYNIRPFSGTPSGSKKSSLMGGMLPSDEDDLDEEDLEAITCFTGIIPSQIGGGKSKGQDGDGISGSADISMVGPGAYGMGTDSSASANTSVVMERMCTDISSLKKQYHRLKQRQTQAHIIIAAASAKQRTKVKAIVPKIETPKAMNHLFIGKQASAPNVNAKNRFVTASPRIAPVFPKVTMIPRFLQNGSKKPSPSKMRKEQSLTESRVIAEENKSEEETDKEEEQELSAPVQSEIDSNEINDISKTEENNKKEDDTNEIEGEENEDDIEKKENDEKYVSEIDHCKENQSKVKCEGCDESESHHSGVVEMETEKNTGLLSSMLEDMSLSNEIIEALNQLNSDDVERTESDVINDDKVSSTETGEMVKSSSDNVGPTEEERNSNVDNDNVSVTTSEALENVAVSADNIDSTDNIDSIDKTDECVSIREEVEKFLLDTCQENVDDKSDIYLHDQCPEIQEEISLGSFNSHDCHEEFIHKLPEDFHGRSLEEEVLDIANRISSNNAQNLLHDVFGVASEECSSLPEIDATIDDYNISESGENCDQGCEISTNDKSLSEDESKILKNSDECVHSVSESTDLRQNSFFPHHKENSDSNLNTNENSNPSITNYAKDNIDYSSHAKGLRIKSIDLAKYKESKKSVSRSCSQESESSKYFTDSDTSVFSPDSDKSISWTSDVKSFNNFKHAVSKKPFNPFPVTHFNENRAKTGIKLGLYKSSMFMQMEKQPKRKPLWSK